MTRQAQLLFAALVVATLGAFAVVQRLKQSPRLVQTLTVSREYSPRITFQRAGIRLKLTRRADDVTVSLLDEDGDVVRRLVRNRRYAREVPIQLFWNGRDERGRIVPDGTYRVRVGLRRQGRSVTLVDEIRTDATPPRPILRVQRPEGGEGPLIYPLPGGGPVRFEMTVPGGFVGTPTFRVYRTDLGRPKAVARVRAGAGATEGAWNGRVAGSPIPAPGTYVIGAQVRDSAGNFGSSFPFAPARRDDPPGGAGVTVRYVAGQGPLGPVRAGTSAGVFVDSRRAPYTWRLHRLGRTRTLARGRGRRPLLRVRAPRGPSGVYLLELAANRHRATVPIPVTGPGRQRVLVVLPLVTWQGLNPTDDDGDGLPDTLEQGDGPVRLTRPFAHRGEPPGFARSESPLLRLLDRPRQRYDLQTDYALARAPERSLDAYGGVVLAGNPRWLEPALAQRLRRYVDRGGRVFSPGTDSLRREVRVREGLLVDPSGQSSFDLFGSVIAPLSDRGVDLLAAEDAIGLFEGGDGAFAGFRGYEATRDPGRGGRITASAQTPDGRPVIVAIRLGEGLVVRTGLAEWSRRLGNPNVATMTRRIWALFSR